MTMQLKHYEQIELTFEFTNTGMKEMTPKKTKINKQISKEIKKLRKMSEMLKFKKGGIYYENKNDE